MERRCSSVLFDFCKYIFVSHEVLVTIQYTVKLGEYKQSFVRDFNLELFWYVTIEVEKIQYIFKVNKTENFVIQYCNNAKEPSFFLFTP